MVMGELAVQKDVVVIGSGPAGYVCAIRLGQLGKKVMLIENEKLGGVCLNIGCIPSKALISFSHMVENLNDAGTMGISAKIEGIDFEKTQAWKQAVVDKLISGIKFLLEKNNVEIVYGNAYFESANRLKIDNNPEMQAVEFRKCVIATGSKPMQLKGVQFDGKQIVGSTEALSFTKIPKTLAVIGGGYVGIELAGVYASLGTKVTVIEAGPRILPIVEKEFSDIVEGQLKEKKVEILSNTLVQLAEKTDTTVRLSCIQGGMPKKIEAEKVLVAIGRKPWTESLRLQNTQVQSDEKGFIKVNKAMKTTDPSIYAIGDVAGQPMLAHKAFREGKIAAESIAGMDVSFDNVAMPSVIFSEPEIAVVGLSEEEAKKQGYETIIGRFPFSASGRAMTVNETKGFVKVVGDRASQSVLGIGIVGYNASELLGEASLAVEMGARLEDIAATIHAHPTLSETIMEAAEDALGKSVHIFRKKPI